MYFLVIIHFRVTELLQFSAIGLFFSKFLVVEQETMFTIVILKYHACDLASRFHKVKLSVYGKYSTRGHVERLIQHKVKPSAVFALRHHPPSPNTVLFVHTSIGNTLSVILYFLVIWLGAIFSSTQTTAMFGDQDISKSLYNLFLLMEQTNRISLASDLCT